MSRPPRKITPQYLERAALHYLERYTTSTENLRRVLLRKVRRSAEHHGTDPDEALPWIETLLARFGDLGYLDDRTYAETKTRGLFRRGDSPRAIQAKLRAKGVDTGLVEELTDGLDALAAAVNLARRKRLGPYRPMGREEHRDKDLAKLARAGFGFEVARKVVEAESLEALEDAVAEDG